MGNHRNGMLLLVLVVVWYGLDAQNSPTPTITDYDGTSLPAIWQTGGDTTFCKRQVLTVHGTDFHRATGGESFDTLWAVIGIFGCPILSSNISGNGNDDRITIRVPQYFAEDTCVRLKLIKRTWDGGAYHTYDVEDTVCLTGDSASVVYGGAAFCVGDTAPRPSITLWPSTAVGMFCCASGAPGFYVNPANGEIPLHPGAVGVANSFMYCTSHTRCADTSWFTVAVNARQQAVATMNGGSAVTLCAGGGVAMADTALLVPSGGTFRATPGLHLLSAQWGMVDPALSVAGLHQLWYLPGDPCWDSVRIDILIEQQENPSFSYPPSGVYCLGDPDPWPLVTGTGGGAFRAVTPGTVVDADGRLRLAASGPGMHVVRYRTPGACPDSLDVAVDIYAAASAAFQYAGSLFCTGDTSPVPLITGTPGGTFSADSGCVVNPVTGGIGLDLSLPGTYNVTYSHTGSCQSSFTQTVVIGATDSTTMISYFPFRFCQSGLDPVPLVSGDTVGRFVAGGGIVFANTDIGQLDLSAMSPGGPYLVYYDIENRCARDVEDSVWIEWPDDPGFSYPESSYCAGGVNPLPDMVAMPGGTFGELTMNVVFLDNATGLIDASRSNSGGPYFIRHTTSGPCPETSSFQLTILPKPTGATLSAVPDSVICEGEDVSLVVDAGGIASIRWLEGGHPRPAYDDEESIMVYDHATGADTVTAILGNALGCYDTLVAPLQWLARPVLDARRVSVGADESGLVTAVYELDTDDPVDSVQAVVGLLGGDPAVPVTVRPTGWPYEYRVALSPRHPQDLQVVRASFLAMGPACSGESDVLMDTLVAGESRVFVPGVFTPNGDGKNDTWMVICTAGEDPADYRMEVFNASNGKVFEMSPIHSNWDGGALPDGVYWWVLLRVEGPSSASGTSGTSGTLKWRDESFGGVTIRRR